MATGNTYVFKGNSKVNKLIGKSDVLGDITNKMFGYGGDDLLQGGSFANNLIWGGDGNDTIRGGFKTDRLYGEAGNDTLEGVFASDSRLYGGDGNDTLKASTNGSYMDGGSGSDKMYGSDAADTYVVGSSKDVVVEVFTPEFDNQMNPRDTVRAYITYILGAKLEDIVLVGEKAISATGNSVANTLIGNSAANIIKGEAGRDILVGGKGADDLWGGSSADQFTFRNINESPDGQLARDTIFDFSGVGGDKINLKEIDASTKQTGNQSFTFIGATKFQGSAGELRFEKKSSDTYIYADVNGDKVADFSIHLDDAIAMQKGYFVL